MFTASDLKRCVRLASLVGAALQLGGIWMEQSELLGWFLYSGVFAGVAALGRSLKEGEQLTIGKWVGNFIYHATIGSALAMAAYGWLDWTATPHYCIAVGILWGSGVVLLADLLRFVPGVLGYVMRGIQNVHNERNDSSK